MIFRRAASGQTHRHQHPEMLATARDQVLAWLLRAALFAYACDLPTRQILSFVVADFLVEGFFWASQVTTKAKAPVIAVRCAAAEDTTAEVVAALTQRAVADAMATVAEWRELAVAATRAECEAAADERVTDVTAACRADMEQAVAGARAECDERVAACERRANAFVEDMARAVADEETARVHAALDARRDGGTGWGRLLLEPPRELRCPITHDVMIDPVVAGDGNCYERGSIEEWFSRSSRFPLTNEELPDICSRCRSNLLVPCVTLRKMCQDWREWHPCEASSADAASDVPPLPCVQGPSAPSRPASPPPPPPPFEPREGSSSAFEDGEEPSSRLLEEIRAQIARMRLRAGDRVQDWDALAAPPTIPMQSFARVTWAYRTVTAAAAEHNRVMEARAAERQAGNAPAL